MKKMKKMVFQLAALAIIIIIAATLWPRIPIIGSVLSKQTIYIGFLDFLHGPSKDTKAYAMWIDDDSTIGVFKVKEIADSIGIPPNFAVIADRMEPEVADSLVSWQRHGAGIILHGLRHERWWNWDASQIEADIQKSYQRLHEQGFDTMRILKIIIPPHGCNNRTIRKVIAQQGCKMISGASLINPDRHVFQYGRIGIGPNTDIEKMRQMLQKAYDRKAFVIFGTHSSIPSSFSEKKTREILRIAKEIGFNFKYE
jgi:hypothetical protein